MNRSKKWFAAVLMILCMALGVSGTALAAGKGVRIKKTFAKYSQKADDSLSVLFGAEQKTMTRATKSMKLSCTLYIPTSALKKAHDFIHIDPMTYMFKGKQYFGTVFGKFRVQLELNEKKQPVLYKATDDGISGVLAGKYGSVTVKNGYYVVKLKKLPLCSWAFELTPDQKMKINTKQKMYLASYVRVYRHAASKWTGYLYVDDLTLYAKKTLKMTFDKKDYGDVFAYLFVKGNVPVAVKNLPF